MGSPYTWNEKHLETAGLPVPAGPDDAGKTVVVNAEGNGYELSDAKTGTDQGTQTSQTSAKK